MVGCSLAELDFGGALAALVLRGLGDGGDMGMVAEIFAQSAAKDAHAGAVDDADAREAGEEGAVEEALDFVWASSAVRPMTLISEDM